MRLLYRFHSSTMNYLSLDSPSELPVIYTENERRIHEKINNHENFNVMNDWFADVRKLKKSCTCGGCLKRELSTPGIFIYIQRVYFMLGKTTSLYRPLLDFTQVKNVCKK